MKPFTNLTLVLALTIFFSANTLAQQACPGNIDIATKNIQEACQQADRIMEDRITIQKQALDRYNSLFDAIKSGKLRYRSESLESKDEEKMNLSADRLEAFLKNKNFTGDLPFTRRDLQEALRFRFNMFRNGIEALNFPESLDTEFEKLEANRDRAFMSRILDGVDPGERPRFKPNTALLVVIRDRVPDVTAITDKNSLSEASFELVGYEFNVQSERLPKARPGETDFGIPIDKTDHGVIYQIVPKPKPELRGEITFNRISKNRASAGTQWLLIPADTLNQLPEPEIDRDRLLITLSTNRKNRAGKLISRFDKRGLIETALASFDGVISKENENTCWGGRGLIMAGSNCLDGSEGFAVALDSYEMKMLLENKAVVKALRGEMLSDSDWADCTANERAFLEKNLPRELHRAN